MITRYLDAVRDDQGIEITIGGRRQWIARARFGLHLQLSRLALDFELARNLRDGDEMARVITAYLDKCGVNEGTGVERLVAFAQLLALNSWQWELAFMRQGIDPATEAPVYDYLDRCWAVWVHDLASRYGWTRDYIFSLWPEEVACYVQEIMVSEYHEMEARRAMSETSYSYDKATHKSRFLPTPKPAWMLPKKEQTIVRLRADMLPLGHIVNLSGLDRYGNPILH